MNQVFKGGRRFRWLHEFRRERMDLDTLKPYDLALQLLKIRTKYGYEETLTNISVSYAAMDRPSWRC
jgi:oligoendopeptidase F